MNVRKHHIVLDTIGNLLDVVVHAANIQDYHRAKRVLHKVTETVDTLQQMWADGMYEKNGLGEWVCNTLQIALDVVKRPATSRALSSCLGTGWWSGLSLGSVATVASVRTMSAAP